MGGTWGVAATLCRMGAPIALLACMCPGLVPGQQCHYLPPPPPYSHRMTFMAHAIIPWSPPRGYGTWSPALSQLKCISFLMWYEGKEYLKLSQGHRGRVNPRPDARLRMSLMGPTLSLRAVYLVVLLLGWCTIVVDISPPTTLWGFVPLLGGGGGVGVEEWAMLAAPAAPGWDRYLG